METVVEEKPLSLATSRIVTMVLFMQDWVKASTEPRARLEFGLVLADTTAESETSVKFRFTVCGGGAHAGELWSGECVAGRSRAGYWVGAGIGHKIVWKSGSERRPQALV